MTAPRSPARGGGALASPSAYVTCGAAYDVTFADPDKGTVVVGGAVVGIGVTGAVGVGCGVVGVTHRMETPPSLP